MLWAFVLYSSEFGGFSWVRRWLPRGLGTGSAVQTGDLASGPVAVITDGGVWMLALAKARLVASLVVLGGFLALACGASAAQAAVVFDGSPGSGPAPATLGGYAMTSFPADTRDDYTEVTDAAAPSGSLTFGQSMGLYTIGPTWHSGLWAGGTYSGRVYSADYYLTVTMTLPAGTRAFSFYGAPTDYGTYTMRATAQDGTTSGPTSVYSGYDQANAHYFGFYATNGDEIQSITVSDRSPSGFGVGNFASYQDTTPTPDTTPPVTTITLDPASPNGDGDWYTSAVAVTVAGDDNGGSGVAQTRCALDPVSPPVTFADLPAGDCALSTVTSDGTHTIYAASTDADGNGETPVSVDLKIDATDPALAPTVSPSALYLNASGVASANATDTGGSGIASSSCDALVTTSAGDHTVTCHATDNAGNTNSATIHYTVQYRIVGFFSPLPASKWKSGQSVPIKVALADADGTRISDVAAAGLLAAPCAVKFSATGVQPQNSTCMKYDPATHQFSYSWKLGKALGAGTIKVTISYPATTTTTTKTESITITK
jgi:hypothetical protein